MSVDGGSLLVRELEMGRKKKGETEVPRGKATFTAEGGPKGISPPVACTLPIWLCDHKHVMEGYLVCGKEAGEAINYGGSPMVN